MAFNPFGLPNDVLLIVTEKAKRDWPDDFLMQKHTIEEQSQAFVQLQGLVTSEIPSEVMNVIRKKAVQEWRDDYLMQLHTISQQLEAYVAMHS